MRQLCFVLALAVSLLITNLGETFANEGPAMLPMFGNHSRQYSANGDYGWQFAQHADGYDDPDWVYHPGFDFNLESESGVNGYIYAIADGIAIVRNVNSEGVPASYGELLLRHEINGQTFYSAYYHCSKIYVSNGQSVKKGNRIALIGSIGAGNAVHLHWEIRISPDHPDEEDVDYWGYSLQSSSNVSSWYRDPERFVCSLNVAYEASTHNPLDLGSTSGNLDWWYALGSVTDLYNSTDHTSRHCYRQNYSGGNYGSCAIVFDALGGSRRAYTVRTGFWSNGQGNGWSQLYPAGQPTQLGPQGPLGMPITNEYAVSGGSRQDFQKGYLLYSGGNVTVNSYTAPGATSNGWNNQYSYLFALAYERNGGRNTVGIAQGNVSAYGPYLRQNFDGGSFGECCILYDPDNADGNAQATNEAYLLRTGFYDFYVAGDGWEEYGCPSRDEYATGDAGDAIQFFFVRSGNDMQHHHMYWDASENHLDWNSTYACDWVSQTPSGKFAMLPGQTKQVTVQFRNESDFTWRNSGTSYPYDYVTLKSVASNGIITESFFNYPVDGSLGWIDTYTPCTMQQSSVAPGQTATFTFTIKVPSNATPGIRQVHFRPYHSTGGLLDDWGGMHFYHYTVVEGVDYDFDGDGIADYWDRTSTGEFHLDYASTNLTEWDTTFYGYGGSNDDPAPADYDGDGKYDMAILKNSNSIFYIDYARNGFGAWDDSLGGYGVAADYPCPGDYDGDKVDDISVRDADGDWHIDYFALGNGFGAWDTTFYGYGGSSDRPAQADYNGDGKCDFAILRNSDRKFLIDYAPGFGSWDVTNLGGYGGFADYPAPADYDNDGSDDIAVLNTTDRALRVDRTGNGFNGWDYVLGGYGGTGDRPMPADYDGDGWDDVATYYAAYDQICLDYASNNYGSWDWCDDGPDHPTWKVATQEEPATLPSVFSVSQNYPNPFNPATSISFSLPKATHVTLEVYNVLGQRVELLVDTDLPAGIHSAVWEANNQASGIYFYRLRTEDADATKKMLLLK